MKPILSLSTIRHRPILSDAEIAILAEPRIIARESTSQIAESYNKDLQELGRIMRKAGKPIGSLVLSKDKRKLIYKKDTLSTNQLAKEHGVLPSTISAAARYNGHFKGYVQVGFVKGSKMHLWSKK
jgi:hypothetical protein